MLREKANAKRACHLDSEPESSDSAESKGTEMTPNQESSESVEFTFTELNPNQNRLILLRPGTRSPRNLTKRL